MIPEISVCIPVYNAEKTIEQTLKTILNQTITQIEIIICDNASTDGTGKIVCENMLKDERIQYYRNDSNIGYVGNIRKAVGIARAEYIAIYHSDDLYDPTILEKQLQVLDSNPHISAVFTTLYSFIHPFQDNKIEHKVYEKLRRCELYDKNKKIFIGDIKRYIPVIAKYGNIFACPSLFCRKDTYLAVGGFTDEYPSNEDFDLWLRFLENGFSLAIIDEPLLFYRISDFQGTSYFKNSDDLPAMYRVIEDYFSKHPEYLEDPLIDKDFRRLMSRGYCHASYRNLKKFQSKGVQQLISSKRIYAFRLFSKAGIFQWVVGPFLLILTSIKNKIYK